MAQEVNLIFGPPGTGKTTHLLRLLENELKTVSAESIAFVSYTKKGVEEGTARATDKFNLAPKDKRFFRTLHSLCFKNLGVRRESMVSAYHMHVLGNVIGTKLNMLSTEGYITDDDRYIQGDHLLRNNFKKGKEFLSELSRRKFEYIVGSYAAMKRQLRLYDFTDLLQEYVIRGTPLPVKTAFVDEAQDLTPLQWEVVKKMFSHASKVYIAGDDDQAIYSWAGADVSAFLNLDHTSKKVLDYSFRLPTPILDFALSITNRISPEHRQQKVFSPAPHAGSVTHCSDWNDVPLNMGSTLILARANVTLTQAKLWLRSLFLPYTLKGVPGIDPVWFEAIQAYEQWQGGAGDDTILPFSHHFTRLDRDKPWHIFADMPYKDKLYAQRMWEKGIWSVPPVRLETIHSSKGAEADHVVLALDITPRVARSFFGNWEDELRCYYVGATRAKKTLTLKHSKEPVSYPLFTTE